MSDFPFSIPRRGDAVAIAPVNAFKQTSAQRVLTIFNGNPTDVAGSGKEFGGAVTELSTSIVLTQTNQNVFITCRVVGELDENSVNFGVMLHRSGGTGANLFLRAAVDGDRGRVIGPNVISRATHTITSLDTMFVPFVDTKTSAGTYVYTPVGVNTELGSRSSKSYQLNRVTQSNDQLNHEVGVSTMVLQVL